MPAGPRLTRRTAALSGAAVLGVLVLVLVLFGPGADPGADVRPVAAPTSADPPAPESETAAPVTTAEPPTPAPTATTPPTRQASSVRLDVPTLGLDVPVLPYTPADEVIDPPTMADSYWIQPYGEPGTAPDNTVYIAGHSWTKGAAAFNALMPGDHGAGVATGDVVTVATPDDSVDYTVSHTERYDKDALPAATDVWAVAPGRLVLITCFVDDDGRATDDNFVVFAES